MVAPSKVKKMTLLKMHHIKKITPLLFQKLFKTNNFHACPKKNLAQKLIQLSTFWNHGARFYSTFGYF